MNKLTFMAFDDHEQWLADGGSEAMSHVKKSNLLASVNVYIERAFQEGYDAGYREGVKEATDGQS